LTRLTKYLFVIIFLFEWINLSAQTWQLVWADEFDGASINAANWTRETGGNGWGNNELQYYTNRSVNSYIESGSLVIKAQSENYSGNNYTSARLKTQGKKFFKYGKIEARMKLPYGQGIWPAFWTLGENINSVGWPACGEIDIMEFLGHQTNKVYGTGHWGEGGQHQQSGGSYTLPTGNFPNDYHLFTIIWDNYFIKWYVDNSLYYTLSITPAYLSEFHENQFIILNLAVGGNWPGYPDPTTVFPQYMYVDYVRVYKDSLMNIANVNITSPSNNSTFQSGSNINITASVGGFANPVNYVEFYQGDARVGVDTQEPYEFNWTGVYDGEYSIKAKAKDNAGNIISSEPVTITVGEGFLQSPYLGKPVLLPGVIEMENYNLGGAGIAYNDTDPAINQGNQTGNDYRVSEGVDLQATTDAGGGYNIGWNEAGEWLNYFVDVSHTGNFRLAARVSGNTNTGSFKVEVDGNDVSGVVMVPSTNGWQNWVDVNKDDIYLEKGVHVLTYNTIASGFNINRLVFSQLTDVEQPDIKLNDFELYQNYPNPFNPTTKIKYSVPSASLNKSSIANHNSSIINLKVYGVLGNEVATLVNEYKAPGTYEVTFDGKNLPSGVYYCSLKTGTKTISKKIILLK